MDSSKSSRAQIALSHKCCKTQAARESIEKKFGIRYSILNELPYSDPPQMYIIDPVHNLLLGTAKHNRGLEVIKNDH